MGSRSDQQPVPQRAIQSRRRPLLFVTGTLLWLLSFVVGTIPLTPTTKPVGYAVPPATTLPAQSPTGDGRVHDALRDARPPLARQRAGVDKPGTPQKMPQVRVADSAPALTARAVIAVDLTNQALLYEHDADTPLPPASTAKIVTALVVAGTLDLSRTVEIVDTDLVDTATYAHMGLAVGDQLSVEELLTGLLVASAGDAANALARVGGRQLGATTDAAARQYFVAEMNRLAQELGMRGSWFATPDGRDSPGQHVTARDLAIATEALFAVPVLERIVRLPMATVTVEGPNAREITLYNTNQMLGLPGVHGVKTGTTPAAGQCLVAAVWRGDARIVTVVLGSSDRYADTQALLDWLDQHYAWIRIAPRSGYQPLASLLAERGVTIATTRTLLLTREDAASLALQIEESGQHPTTAVAPVGTVVLTVDGEEVLKLPLFAAGRFSPAALVSGR